MTEALRDAKTTKDDLKAMHSEFGKSFKKVHSMVGSHRPPPESQRSSDEILKEDVVPESDLTPSDDDEDYNDFPEAELDAPTLGFDDEDEDENEDDEDDDGSPETDEDDEDGDEDDGDKKELTDSDRIRALEGKWGDINRALQRKEEENQALREGYNKLKAEQEKGGGGGEEAAQPANVDAIFEELKKTEEWKLFADVNADTQDAFEKIMRMFAEKLSVQAVPEAAKNEELEQVQKRVDAMQRQQMQAQFEPIIEEFPDIREDMDGDEFRNWLGFQSDEVQDWYMGYDPANWMKLAKKFYEAKGVHGKSSKTKKKQTENKKALEAGVGATGRKPMRGTPEQKEERSKMKKSFDSAFQKTMQQLRPTR